MFRNGTKRFCVEERSPIASINERPHLLPIADGCRVERRNCSRSPRERFAASLLGPVIAPTHRGMEDSSRRTIMQYHRDAGERANELDSRESRGASRRPSRSRLHHDTQSHRGQLPPSPNPADFRERRGGIVSREVIDDSYRAPRLFSSVIGYRNCGYINIRCNL